MGGGRGKTAYGKRREAANDKRRKRGLRGVSQTGGEGRGKKEKGVRAKGVQRKLKKKRQQQRRTLHRRRAEEGGGFFPIENREKLYLRRLHIVSS